MARRTSQINQVSLYLRDHFAMSTDLYLVQDPLGVAVSEAVRRGPFSLALRDIWICIRMFNIFPGVITPLWTENPQDEFYVGWGPNLFGLALLSMASTLEVVLLFLCVPTFLFLPGPISIFLFILGQALIHVICYPLQGPSKVWSKAPTDPETIAKYKRVADERWFFLNGCCVSGHNLQQNVDVLSETFKRPIFAIHNRTYGVLGDLFECILQRSFDLFTEESRVCYEYIKAYCADPEVKKVILIAHSQGCIMASQILDQLYVDMPAAAVSKLEVYTLGNAASHFNNPLRQISDSDTSIDARDVDMMKNNKNHSSGTSSKETETTKPGNSSSSKSAAISEMLPERIIAHIEHYCNSQDMVTRWGALYSAKSILQNRFCGHIFINEGASGHMLNQHYLGDMFPLHHRRAGAGHARGTSSDSKHHGVPFLDRIVNLDTATVTQRQSNQKHQLAVMRHESAPHEVDDHSHKAKESQVHNVHDIQHQREFDELALTLGEGVKLENTDLSGAEGSRISVVRKLHLDDEYRYKGKTVRQLSRLWRYLDGGSPQD
ncbi:hypothetical protein K402DRAFT_11862 [Aulographum hederae CBS 113979]|uniref:DUF676 domain-containing protein n=1 Tax=Aulographum hederae CBS 113979 TaxID=1176131 RepID=A0A6G1H6W8_9PEZI|nr:hypothetical protein K402DRAFT_11862 [Aulographum hederae CBS 113979]